MLTCRYRLLPTKRQHRALEAILESQRQLYNAALEERIVAYRKAKVARTYFDQSKALTEWRQDDPDASALPVNLQRATLRRLDEAYRGFFRRVKAGSKTGLSAVSRQGLVRRLRLSRVLRNLFASGQASVQSHAGGAPRAPASAGARGGGHQELRRSARCERVDGVPCHRVADTALARGRARGRCRPGNHHLRRAFRWRSDSQSQGGAPGGTRSANRTARARAEETGLQESHQGAHGCSSLPRRAAVAPTTSIRRVRGWRATYDAGDRPPRLAGRP